MPLSEYEQRALEEIERSLLDEDPEFANAVRASDPRHHTLRRAIGAGAVFLCGVALLVLALLTGFTPAGVPVLGIAGFVVMFLAALLAVRAYRGGPRPDAPARSSKQSRSRSSSPQSRSSIVTKLEERWKRRRGDSL